jgi:L-malate glycosyltransferase
MMILYIGNKVFKHGNSITIIESLSILLSSEGYELITYSSKKNILLRLIDMLLGILVNYRKVGFLLIDTYSTYSFWYAFLGSQLARLLGLKYIPILHGGNLPYRLKKSPFLCKLIFNHSYLNIAPSNYLLESFKNQGYKNLRYIPNVLEIQNYSFKERKSFSPKLLWVRSFASIYHPKMAVEVLFQLKEKFPDAILCMIGPDKDGSLIETKKYAESLNLEVEFTGGLTKEAWIKKAENFDIFINTTHFDNTPVSVMEAMALGLPVISTNVGGIPYLLEDKVDSLLVEDGNVTQMVQAIEYCIENSIKAQKIALNARKKVEKFDWNVVKEQWKSILT